MRYWVYENPCLAWHNVVEVQNAVGDTKYIMYARRKAQMRRCASLRWGATVFFVVNLFFWLPNHTMIFSFYGVFHKIAHILLLFFLYSHFADFRFCLICSSTENDMMFQSFKESMLHCTKWCELNCFQVQIS